MILASVNTSGMEEDREGWSFMNKPFLESLLEDATSMDLKDFQSFTTSGLKNGSCTSYALMPTCVSGQELCDVIAFGGREELVKRLLDLRGKIKYKDGEYLPLNNACLYGHLAIVKMFLARGVKPKLFGPHGSPLAYSLYKFPDSGIAKLLIANGALLADDGKLDKVHVQLMLYGAVLGGSLHFTQRALELRANPNKASFEGCYFLISPLQEIVNKFVEENYDNSKCTWTWGKYNIKKITPLIIELIKWGADPRGVKIPDELVNQEKLYKKRIEPALYPAAATLGGNPAQQLLFREIHGRRSSTARNVWNTRTNKWKQEQIQRSKKEKETYAYMRQLFETEEND